MLQAGSFMAGISIKDLLFGISNLKARRYAIGINHMGAAMKPFAIRLTGALIATAISICGGIAVAQQAPKGGGFTFLIDSLGSTWIPNNSAISSFQGHI